MTTAIEAGAVHDAKASASVHPADPAALPRKSSDRAMIWLALIIGVLVVALASIAAAVTLILTGHSDFANGAWPIATAAVAGVVGLFAKSPTAD
ncbi:hypothetical protein [Microbacterium mangrovi]|uniref:hypothetical protein n=1 Tax=Microbacterium mangrovi TaxID=1348253 RepID=UPI000A622B31|nr:hypothetical protein [Microbacterium mangrovi]